ncbi:unnamed protein product [Polarella glacialis]|uniref:Cyclic nucleotide-binding domain-containing protein n=1 Tax=Polarella glacialis TaxID=89957 RepID=A0A813JRH7_POLGL|nr:unnamed protein product [Polarella glacialis]
MLLSKKKGASDEDDSSPKLRYETPRSSKSRSAFSHHRLLEFPFLAGRDPRFLDLLTSEVDVCLFQAGETIMKEGDVGETMYFLVMGKVAIWKEPGPVKLCERNVFGEMALLEGRAAKRTATVKAVEFCDCRVLHQRVFNKILKRFPIEKEFYDRMAAERAAAKENARDKLRKAVYVLGGMKGLLRAQGEDQAAEDADPKPSISVLLRMRSSFAGVSAQASAAAASGGDGFVASSTTQQLLDLTAKRRLRKSLFCPVVPVPEVMPVLEAEEGCEELSRQESKSQADTSESKASLRGDDDNDSPITRAAWNEAASNLSLGATLTTTTTAATATTATAATITTTATSTTAK